MARASQQPTAALDQPRLLVRSTGQETYELLRPIVRFGQPAGARARESGVLERALRLTAACFDAIGMRVQFDDSAPTEYDGRRLPEEIRRAIVELKAECSALRPYEPATNCRHRFDRPVGHHTVECVLASEPLPIRPPRRVRCDRDIPDPVERRQAIVTLCLQGWTPRASPATSTRPARSPAGTWVPPLPYRVVPTGAMGVAGGASRRRPRRRSPARTGPAPTDCRSRARKEGAAPRAAWASRSAPTRATSLRIASATSCRARY
jgi:hypothetical protein